MKSTLPSQDALVLGNLDQLRAFTDPLRQQIFERLIDAPMTAKQLATAMGAKPTSLYYHFGVLERAGLIRKVRTRKVRGTVEKYYKAAASRVLIDPAMLGAAGEVEPLVASAFQSALAEIAAAKDALHDPMVRLHRLKIRTTPERFAALLEELDAWLENYEAASDDEGTAEYGLTMALYELARGS